MFWVYILYSDSSKRYYIGQTNDIVDRINRHNSGCEKSTSPHKPWRIVCQIQKASRSESMILEKKLKNLNTEDLEKFIIKNSAK